jgi:plastocyanin
MLRFRIGFVVLAVTAVVLAGALPASAHLDAAGATVVTVTAGKPSEFKFKLSRTSVPHGVVTFKITNVGVIVHNFKICSSPRGGTANACTGKAVTNITPLNSKSLTYTFKTKGTYEYLCTVTGHAAAGMKGDLKVT